MNDMSGNKASPSIIFSQPSTDSDSSEHLTCGKPVNISRSRSAPQPENQFTSLRMGILSKISPKSPKKFPNHLETDDNQNIPTLSDGVVSVDQSQVAQAAANVMSAHHNHHQQQIAGASAAVVSPTPLCDSNHSPTSTKRYYQQISPIFDSETKPDDVWQRREQFVSSGPSEGIDSSDFGDFDVNTSSNTMLRSELKERRVKRNSQSCSSNNEHSENHLKPNGITETVNGGHSTLQSPEKSLTNKQQEDECVEMRNTSVRRPLRHAHSEMLLPSDIQRKLSMDNVAEKGYARLAEELSKAQKALEVKEEEVGELRGIRERLMKEVSDFTASLFEEVNSQLNTAALSEQHAKKQLQEASHKIEMLSAEVTALKKLVLTSTPSDPNKHLHPQLDDQKKEKGGMKPFWKTHRRSTSHHLYTKESREKAEATEHHSQLKEMDNNAYDEFTRWRLQPNLDFSCQFLIRVHEEDITPCLNFKNTKLSERLLEGVKQNSLSIEPIPGDHSFPRKCVLSETHKLCNYKIRFEGDDEWHSISQMSRNRIATVCDFLSYIRYIIQGLVKSSDKDMFVEVVKLRHKMAQARLGLV